MSTTFRTSPRFGFGNLAVMAIVVTIATILANVAGIPLPLPGFAPKAEEGLRVSMAQAMASVPSTMPTVGDAGSFGDPNDGCRNGFPEFVKWSMVEQNETHMSVTRMFFTE
jgi:hypothetical protein